MFTGPLNVFITIDTELSPQHLSWSAPVVKEELDREVYALTPQGEFGVRFQADLVRAFGLKAVFFVEALCGDVVGEGPLRGIVRDIQERDQEVQLHVHSEWLSHMRSPVLPGRSGYNLREFSEDEQRQLIERGIANLRRAGAEKLCAFRAGNFGANHDTLRALARAGIIFDSSHNTCALASDCDLPTPNLLLQPARIHGVYEFPMTFFADRAGHYRHAQLCACSSGELESALLEAWRRGWFSFVLLSHSFELLRSRNHSRKPCAVSRIVLKRFERLCHFLANNRDKFRTATFSDVVPKDVPSFDQSEPLQGNIYRTAWRIGEQIASRIV